MLLSIQHETRLRLNAQTRAGVQRLRLTPRQEAGQSVAHWHLDVPGHTRARRDAHGNLTHFLTLADPRKEVVIRVEGLVETTDEPVVLPEGELPVSIYLAATAQTRATPELALLAHDSLSCEPDPVYGLFDLMAAVRRHVPYLPCIDYAGGSAAEAFALGVGAREDLAHLFIAACRQLGIPARYASGYILADPKEPVTSHAWAEAWVSDLGWIGFDIVNNRTADGRLCKLAIGRDQSEACPIRFLQPDSGENAMH